MFTAEVVFRKGLSNITVSHRDIMNSLTIKVRVIVISVSPEAGILHFNQYYEKQLVDANLDVIKQLHL